MLLLALLGWQGTSAQTIGDEVPFTAIEAGAKYHLKQVESGFYLHYQDYSDSKFSVNTLVSANSTFEFEFIPAGAANTYYLRVGNGAGGVLFFVGDGYFCGVGATPNGVNSQIQLQASGSDGQFVMKALWRNYIRGNAAEGSHFYADWDNAASGIFQLELAATPPADIDPVLSFPVDNAANVDYITDNLVVIFNKSITLAAGASVTVSDGTNPPITVNGADLSVNVSVLSIHVASLAPSTDYTVTIPANTIEGYASVVSWSFSTCPEILYPPLNGKRYNIVHSNGKYLKVGLPTGGLTIETISAENAATDADYIFTFMDAGSGKFYIITPNGFLYRNDYQPSYNLELPTDHSHYIMEVSRDEACVTIKSQSANASDFLAISNGSNIEFRKPKTGGRWTLVQLPDVTSINLDYTSPADNSKASAKTVVAATFSAFIEAVTPESLEAITIKDAENNPVNNVQSSIIGPVLTITHADFERGKTYTVTIPANTINNYDDGEGYNTAITWSFSIPAIAHGQKYSFKNVTTGKYLTLQSNNSLKVQELDATSSKQTFEIPAIPNPIEGGEYVNIMLASTEQFLTYQSGSNWLFALSDDEIARDTYFKVTKNGDYYQFQNIITNRIICVKPDPDVIMENSGWTDNTEDWELIPVTSTTWTGAIDTDWNKSGNWTAAFPAETDDVTIATNGSKTYPVVPSAKTIGNLTVEAGAELGGQELLTFTEATVKVNVASDRWNMLSLPIAATAGDFLFEGDGDTYISTFDETGWVEANTATTLGIGQGFIVWVDNANQEFSLTGTTLAGESLNESLAFTHDSDYDSDFALVGNPYLSSIDFTQLIALNGTKINDNYQIYTGTGSTDSDEDGNVDADGSYVGYHPLGDWGVSVSETLNQFIAPFQSFIVEKNTGDTGDELVFNTSITGGATGNGVLKAAGNVTDKLEITATNPTASFVTFIANHENSQDAGRMSAGIGNIPDIYTLKGTKALGANIIQTDDLLVPLGIATAYAGNMTLTFKGMDTYDAKITLIDNEKEGNKEIELTGSEFIYSFDYTPAKNAGNEIVANNTRFAIQFAPTTPTAISKVTESNVTVYSKDKSIRVVSSSFDRIKGIYVYDAQGRIVYANDQVNATAYTVNQALAASVYVVKIVTENAVKNIKVINN